MNCDQMLAGPVSQRPPAPRTRHALAVLAAAVVSTAAVAQDNLPLDVPYVPTPQHVVERMLELAEVKSSDFVMDLGCGDGRMVVTAARDYGARGRGVDLNPLRINEAKRNARLANVSDKTEFLVADLFDMDMSEADVLTMYLLANVNLRLRPKILETMKPGTRIVSHAFDMGEWKPDHKEVVDGRSVFYWKVPARVSGRWDMQAGGEQVELRLDQSFQEFSGDARINGRTVPVRDGRLNGAEISFTLVGGTGESRTYRGTVNGNTIQASDSAAWQASRRSL